MRNLALLRDTLNTRFGGVLRCGCHDPDGQVCALELISQVRGGRWTDNPVTTRTWDLRSLNDIEVSDTVRTEHLLPVVAEYMGCMDWPVSRQRRVAERLVLLTVQRLIAELPGLSKIARQQCRNCTTLSEASAAARAAETWAARAADAAARAAAADAAAEAAAAEASAARAAAEAAAEAEAEEAADTAADAASEVWVATARERVFTQTCQLWLDATKE
jgi:nucleoid-associated protein YgaU